MASRMAFSLTSPNFFLEAFQRHHCFGHHAMAAGAADVIIKSFHDVASTFHVADIAHGNNYAVFDQPRRNAPIDPFDLQAKFGHLRDNVLALDLAHVNDRDPVIQAASG